MLIGLLIILVIIGALVAFVVISQGTSDAKHNDYMSGHIKIR